MTVSTSQIRARYTGDGVTVNFPIPFPFYLVTDISVILAGTTLTAGFSISGGNGATGTLTMATAPVALQLLQIILNVPLTQLANLVDGTSFPSATINQVNDRAIQAALRLQDQISRSLRAPDADYGPGMLLPAASARAGMFLGFDGTGNALLTSAGAGTANTLNTLGPILNAQTAAETAAGVTPSNYAYLPTDPRRFGAKIDGVTDDTTAIQTWINLAGNQGSHSQQVLLQGVGGTCMVSQITFNVAGVRFFGNGMIFRGNAVISTTAIVEVKAGLTFQDLAVDGNFNSNYQCAIHWYTNNLNLYNPSFARFVNLQASSALIGLCIGGLPSQSKPIPAQGTVQVAGIATDAPLSESALTGFSTGNSCVIGLWVTQPNCKLALTNCTVIGGANGWAGNFGSSGYTVASTCAMVVNNASTQFSEVSMQGGELVQNSQQTGLFLQLQNAHLYCEGTTIEATCSSYFSGEVGVVFRDCLDFGFNFPANYAPFLIDTNCAGFMNISGSAISFPNGDYLTSAGPLVKGASNISGSFSPNYGHFVVNFDRVDLQDVPYLSNPSINNPASGVNFTLSRCTQSSWTGATRNVLNYLDDRSESLLDGIVDATNTTISAYPQTTNTAIGGWTFAVSSVSQSWGSEASGITVEGFQFSTALHLLSAAGGTSQATSPLINVTPERTYQLKGWIKCPTTNGGAAGILFRAVNFVFTGGVSTTTTSTFVSCPDTAFGNTWQQLSAFVTIPKDTTKIQLNLLVQNAAGVQLLGLQLI